MTIKPRKNFAHRSDNHRLDRTGGKHTKNASSNKETSRFNQNDDVFVIKGPFKSKYGKYIKHSGGVNDLKIVMTFLGEQGHHYIKASFVVGCVYELMSPIHSSSRVGTHGFKVQDGIINHNLPGVVLKKGMYTHLESIRFADGTSNENHTLDFIDFHPFMIMTTGRGRHRRLL